MTRDKLIAGYAEWLEQYHWTLFATLTFRGFPSPSRANLIFRKWISEMKEQEDEKDFHWVRVTEYGAFQDQDNVHYHALIGGLRDVCRWHWLRRWDKLAGDSTLTYYRRDYCSDHGIPQSLLNAEHPQRPTGAIPYMLKTAHPDRDFEIDFELAPIATPGNAR